MKRPQKRIYQFYDKTIKPDDFGTLLFILMFGKIHAETQRRKEHAKKNLKMQQGKKLFSALTLRLCVIKIKEGQDNRIGWMDRIRFVFCF